jgi:alpha-1,6-mannosyltransferase
MDRRTGVSKPAVERAVGWGAPLAAIVLAISAALLAAAGADLVPAATDDGPRWILGVFGDGFGISPGLFLALLYLAIGAWALLWLTVDERASRALWALIAVLLAIFTLAPPLLSLDLFSYIAYGRLGAEQGLNPYEFAPAAIPADEAASRVDDFRFAVSVYGPLFTLLSYPLAAIGVGFALWSLKLIAGLSVAAAAVITARIARLRGLAGAPAAAFVALNPLVLVHVVGGGHNDGLMVALALAGALALLCALPATAGFALVASIAVKAAGGLYAPFAIAGAERRGRLFAGMVGAGAALLALALLIFGPEAGSALDVAGENQRTVSRWSVPGTLSRVFDVGVDPVRYLLAALYLAALLALLAWVVRGADWIRAAGWGAFGLLVATAWLVPWYVIWLLPLAAVSRDRWLIAATIALTLFQAVNAVPV